MATSTANIVSSLNAGSGVDIQALAQNLVDAEKAPRADRIQAKIDQSNARISGYGAVSFALDTLKTAFDKLRDVSDFSSITASNSQPTAFGVTAGPTASTGVFDLEVSAIAKAQRSVIGASKDGNGDAVGFAASDTAINGGSPFFLGVTTSAGTEYVSVDTDTPAGLVAAINGADIGLSAQLLYTGSDYQVIITGQEGAANGFTLSTSSDASGTALNLTATMAVDANNLQAAQDAAFTLNGLAITRDSNTISDVVEGVSFNLYGPTTGSARIDLSRNTTDLKASLQELVVAYNDFGDTLDVLGNRDSDVETYGGALAGESFLYTVRSQVRAMVTANSDTAGDNISAFRDIGISFDRYGKMTFDEGTFDTAVASHYDEIVTMMTADTEAQSVYSTAPAGAAGAAYKALDVMLRSTGVIAQRTSNAETDVARQEERMTELDDRMSRVLDRYLKQFAVMDALVGTLQKTGEGLTSTFEGMMATYTNK